MQLRFEGNQVDLYRNEYGYTPNEVELSNETGLTRGQIRRCRLLLDLPDKYKNLILDELNLPKSQQKLSEDFFIEMEKSLKTVIKRLPKYSYEIDSIRDTLVYKFREGTIEAVTDFRKLSKIATAVDNLGIGPDEAESALDEIFDIQSHAGIRDAYRDAVEFGYDEYTASRRIQSITEYIEGIIDAGQKEILDQVFLDDIRKLYVRLRMLLRM